MSKRKLNQRQRQRIQQNQRAQWAEATAEHPQGLLVSHLGSHVLVEDEHGGIAPCYLRQNLATVAVGDRVVWQTNATGFGTVLAVLPRKNELCRPDPHQGMKVMAANLDQVWLVLAVDPAPSEFLIDRYLVAMTALNLPVALVLNKWDLVDAADRAAWQQRFELYQRMGYPFYPISTVTAAGLAELEPNFRHGCHIVVGPSGVGKSSLVNRLAPEVDTVVGAISEISGLGQHTTSRSCLYHLPQGGALIDSPGVRDFELWPLDQATLEAGFVEFSPYLGQCRFRDCQHRSEPGCAILAAAAAGAITERRLESYRRLQQPVE